MAEDDGGAAASRFDEVSLAIPRGEATGRAGAVATVPAVRPRQ